MLTLSSSHSVFAQRTDYPPAIGIILLCVFSVCLSLALPTGFAGWDDLHYVQAAQRWLNEGVNVPANHWATRLPYVLIIAASIRLFGLSIFALTLANTILFVFTLVLVWHITRRIFGLAAAPLSVVVAMATPLFLRMPTTYYPEVLEVVLAGAATAFTLAALQHPFGGRRAAILIAAGLLGGSGVIVRQTALGLPLALSLLIFLRERGQLRNTIGSVCLLAVGYTVPLVAEALFYLFLTGNPMERFRIDSRHVLIPSVHLHGRTFKGSPLFNWKLASEWDVPSAIRLHWTVNPLLRVFTSPGLLLTPWLCVAGGVAAFRRGGLVRQYVIFAGTALLVQYLLDTFVLVIAPDTRYFSVSIFLAIPLAGFLLSQLPRLAQYLGSALLLVAPCLLTLAFAPAPAHLMPALANYASRGQTIHISQDLYDAATIMLANRPDLASHMVPVDNQSRIPVGGLAVIDRYGWTDEMIGRRCPDGSREWRQTEGTSSPPPMLIRPLPVSIQLALMRRQDQLSLVRRAC